MKKCPYCAEEIQDEAVVCHFCGRDLVKMAPPSASIRSRNNARLLTALGGIAIIIGIFLPWFTARSSFGGFSQSFMGYAGDGIFSGLLGLIILIFALVTKERVGKVFSYLIVTVALLDILLVVWKMVSVSNVGGQVLTVSFGIGVYISLVGAAAAIIGGLRKPSAPKPGVAN